MSHEIYMRRCLDLALRGMGRVAPNPMVGAVLVFEGRIIGEGFHHHYGGPHAEVDCVNNVAEADRKHIAGSTMYVSLEPCNHFGKTPPCSQWIVSNGIRKVVAACSDPFEKVNGSGFHHLEKNGVEVTRGILEEEAVQLNKRFFTFQQQQRPYIILKWAQTEDGLIAGEEGRPFAISNEVTNKLVHRWRTEEAAIAVGTNTVLNDNPSLTARLWPGSNPVRIFIDKLLRVDEKCHLLDTAAPTIIFNSLQEKTTGNREYIRLSEEMPFHLQLTAALFRRHLQSVIVEGGATLLDYFIKHNYWDEIRVITARGMKAVNGIKAPEVPPSVCFKKELIRNDEISYYSPDMNHILD